MGALITTTNSTIIKSHVLDDGVEMNYIVGEPSFDLDISSGNCSDPSVHLNRDVDSTSNLDIDSTVKSSDLSESPVLLISPNTSPILRNYVSAPSSMVHDDPCLPSYIGRGYQSSSPSVHDISTTEVSVMSESFQAGPVNWEEIVPLHANPITPDLSNVTDDVTNLSNIDNIDVTESDRCHFDNKTSTTDDATTLPKNIFY